MPEPNSKPRPWLIAAWPGMGSVALIAAGYLIHALDADAIAELPPADSFDVNEVDVEAGLIGPVVMPRGLFHRWRNPGPGRDLVIFLSEAQPTHRHVDYGERLLDIAARHDVERVVTFASLASALHPSENPKVSGVATDGETLAELRRAEVEPIESGQIGGLNGLLLGIAASRGLSGLCFLAEIPFFAMRVPNPKAARAALSVFSVLAGIDIPLDALSAQAAVVDRALIEAMEKLEQQSASQSEAESGADSESDESEDVNDGEDSQSPTGPEESTPASSLDAATKARIEQLFNEVRRNPGEGVRLKQELDRLGVFSEYEGRFLDLFRRAD